MQPATRWVLVAIVVVGIVALLAWARNDAGVDDREPDPPSSTVLAPVDPDPGAPTTVAAVTATT